MVYARHVDLSDEAVKHDHMVREIYPPFYALFDPVRKFPLTRPEISSTSMFFSLDRPVTKTKY